MKKQGIFCGTSGGATVLAALEVCKSAPRGSVVLAMVPDTAERYLSAPLFAGIEADMNEEEKRIGNNTISDYDDLMMNGSPQNRAANWIAHEDESNPDIPIVAPADDASAYDFVVRYILAVVYYSMGGAVAVNPSGRTPPQEQIDTSHWTEQLNFLSGEHYCEWYQIIVQEYTMFPRGVACKEGITGAPPVIDALFLDNNGLVGTLPKEIGLLTTIEILNMDLNEIRGGIPTRFLRLSSLKHLSLAHNVLTGEFPHWIHRMRPIETVDLSYNFMAGTLPVYLSQMENMIALAVDNNGFSGDINKVFGHNAIAHNSLDWFHELTGTPLGNVQMQALYLEDNNFTTTLDETFLRGLSNLKNLDISGNSLNGSIPLALLQMSSLEVLDLHNNELSGLLPALPETRTTLSPGMRPPPPPGLPEEEINPEVPTRMDYKLSYLALHRNKFVGLIPTTINRLSNLQHLDISDNRFSSTMPESLGDLTKLTYMFLAKNDFIAGPIPSSYRQLTQLQELSLKSTARTGTIPTTLFNSNALSRLILLDLDNNAFVGTIPPSFGSLRSIQFLLLNDNQLTGTVPSPEFDRLFNLRLLFIDQNSLTGNLDNTLCDKPPDSFMPYIIADCGDHSSGVPATDAEISCSCCFKCCTDENPCNDNDFIPSNDPMWQFGYQRIFYTFGDRTAWFAMSSP